MKKLSDWEVAIIKAMINRDFKMQDILTYFSRPERSINIARLYEIKREKTYSKITLASNEQLDAFLAQYADGRYSTPEGRLENIISDPFSKERVDLILSTDAEEKLRLNADESDVLEFKESFSWASPENYARILAGYANNRGGYLVFGIDDNQNIVGLKNDKFIDIDPAKISKFLNSHFSPEIRWTKTTVAFGDKKIGMIYAHSSTKKPIICTRDKRAEIREGDIYYRYIGATERVRFPELNELILERLAYVSDQMRKQIVAVMEAGGDNSGVINFASGEVVAGDVPKNLEYSSIFELVSGVKGEIAHAGRGNKNSENSNTTTNSTTIEERPRPLNPEDIVKAFLLQQIVDQPIEYVKQIVHTQITWLPVYYFMKLAEKNIKETVEILRKEKTTQKGNRTRVINRINKSTNRRYKSGEKIQPHVQAVKQKSVKLDQDFQYISCVLMAIRSLNKEDMDLDYLRGVLLDWYEKYYFGQNTALSSAIRYAVCHLDIEFYSPSSET